MLKLSRFNWLKVLSPVAIAASIFVATEVPAEAVPHIYAPSNRYASKDYYRQRRPVAPASLTITPPAGNHISLPRSSRYKYYRTRDRDRYHHHDDCHDRYRGRRRYRNRRSRHYRNYRKRGRRVLIIRY